MKESAELKGKTELKEGAELKGGADLKEGAELKGGVELKESAELKGGAGLKRGTELKGDSELEEDAELKGGAELKRDAELKGETELKESAELKGKAELEERAELKGDAELEGRTELEGRAELKGGAGLKESARLEGEAELKDGVLKDEVLEFSVKTPEEMRKVAEVLVESGNYIFILTGPLGAGKTRLVQEFAKLLGGDEPVTSPTFGVQHIYQTEPPIYHYDLYQKGVDHFLGLGLLEELEREGYHFLEWGEGLVELLKRYGFPVGVVEIEPIGDERRIRCRF